MDRSPPGSSVHGIFQARVLEWAATAFSAAGGWWVISSLWWFVLVILMSTLSLQTSCCLEVEVESPGVRSAMVQNPGHQTCKIHTCGVSRSSFCRCWSRLICAAAVARVRVSRDLCILSRCDSSHFRGRRSLINGPLPSSQVAVLPAPSLLCILCTSSCSPNPAWLAPKLALVFQQLLVINRSSTYCMLPSANLGAARLTCIACKGPRDPLTLNWKSYRTVVTTRTHNGYSQFLYFDGICLNWLDRWSRKLEPGL